MGSSDADQIVGLYERHAHQWARDRGTNLIAEREWLDRFIGVLTPGTSILDIGCGSGVPISGYLIETGFEVVGVDSSPTLISLCRNRFPHNEWIVADMRTLSLNRKFDAILAWDSFFHLSFEDQRAMFPIFKKHSAPAVTLMFTSGPAHGEAIGSYRGEALYHASLSRAEYRELLATNGFKVIEFQPDDPHCGNHTVWLAKETGE
jgi:2-polyprenyl-3-methyl-5-hydroxy-6-metoxy-1,4-benzoquinol methylase